MRFSMENSFSRSKNLLHFFRMVTELVVIISLIIANFQSTHDVSANSGNPSTVLTNEKDSPSVSLQRRRQTTGESFEEANQELSPAEHSVEKTVKNPDFQPQTDYAQFNPSEKNSSQFAKRSAS